MGLFDFLFARTGKKKTPQAGREDGLVKWGSGALQYDPELIPKFKEEHRTLLAMFQDIKQASDIQNFAAAQKALQEFKLALNVHLLAENVRFYAYVRKGLASNVSDLATVNAFWKEMQGITKVVIQFLAKYETAPFTPEMRAAFGSELNAVGEALGQRIRREEEHLYTLYLPSYGD